MKIKEIIDKTIWEEFLKEIQEKTFLQSWNWGEFNKLMRNKIWRLGVYENEELVSVALVVKIVAKRGTFLLLPHGPVTRYEVGSMKYEVLKTLLEKLKEIAKEERCDFIRISPIWLARRSPEGEGGERRNEENIKIFKDSGFKDAPIHMHPEVTWELNINPLEGELLMGMRKTTRYLIRQAQKNKDIEILKSQKLEDIEVFNRPYQEVVSRQHFIPFSLDYLKNEFSAFKSNNQPVRQTQGCPERTEGQISVFLGKYKNEVISSGIFIFWQDIAFYHHGASSLKYPKIPVSYLLQWEAIKEAKKRGCKIFNFWGIVPNEGASHPWVGLTLFKMGFGGYKKEYVKTQDFPLSKKYWLTFLFEKMRKTKRGL